MGDFEMSNLCWVFFGVELLGLAIAWATRISQGSRCQAFCQGLFFVCLAAVGGSTLVSLSLGPGWWLASGVSFALMVLTVTWDFSRSPRLSAW